MTEEYLNYLSSVRRYSPRTCSIYADVLREFTDYRGPRAEGEKEVTVQDVRNYEVHLLDERKLSARTVALQLSVLGGYCRFLMKRGLLESNPVRLVKKPRQEKRLPVFFRQESMKEYFSQTRGVPAFGSYEAKLSRMIVSLLFNTGMRRAELISLNLGSVDFSRGVIRVKGKGDKVREIPLVSSLSKELSLYLQTADEKLGVLTDSEGPLLRTPKGGRLYPVFVDRVIKNELGAVPGVTTRKSPHVLRHTLATELLDDGADLNSIKEMLGHSSLAATQVYTHNSVERLKNVYRNAHPRSGKDKKD